MSLELRLQTATSEYQKLETDISSAVEARQKLDAQLSENDQVKKACFYFIFHPVFYLFSTTHPITPGIRAATAFKRHLQIDWTRFGEAGSGRGESQRRDTAGIYSRRNVRVPFDDFLFHR